MTRLPVLAVLTLSLAGAAPQVRAQSTAPVTPPGAAGSGSTTPSPAADPGLSKGPVVHPGNPDPAMSIAPPQVGITPVIPAPGTTGNGTPVIPK